MNKRVKKLWIKALRSGKYKQGREALHPSEDTFCCLGVLCEVFRKSTGAGCWSEYGAFIARGTEDSCVLPEAVMEWAGLDSDSPRLGTRKNAAYATTLNDSGKSFYYIADRIEKYL
jgi:hypothetical protein